MAKNKNRFGNQSQSYPATAANSDGKDRLEKQTPMWAALFRKASTSSKALGQPLDISIDEDQLKTVMAHINGEDAKAVSSWIEQFASVCGELSKYKNTLDEEHKARWDSCKQKGQELEAKEAELSEKTLESESRSKVIETRSIELAKQQQELSDRESQVVALERDLTVRELHASQGFAKQNCETLAELERQHIEMETAHRLELDQLIEEKESLKGDIRDAFRQLAELRNTRSEEEHLRILQLEEREHKQSVCEQALAGKSSQIEREWDDLRKAKENLDAQVDEEIQQERQSLQGEIERLHQKLDKAWNKIDASKARLEGFRELESSLGDQSAEEFLQQLNNLKQANRELGRKLSASDSVVLEEDNKELRHQVNNLEKDLRELRPELDQARTEAAQKRLAATQLHAIEQEKRVLEIHKNTLALHIDDLESRIEQLTDAHKTQTPFPAMSGMDTGKVFQATRELEDVPDLKIFAEELQHRIAQAERVKLYYSLEDIQVLLGGLAMSQLHVFQGISGTGKTSLAKAFVKAMGGFCTDIAVQAGWRDRDDLLGHYNAFERRYYEKDCLQGLYQAQTPRWSDTCNVVLLDEMNLSRPEQYFSEFLSALEKNNHSERLISLSETALANAPKGLIGGRQILVPPNVWFIGTANHDETTNEMADKTYDRAHVMTLPKQDHSFIITPYSRASFSFKSLQSAFDKSARKHEEKVSALLGTLSSHDITNQLADTFDLGWGNRFERQAKRFIPVMLDCEATAGQALDHLLSTRVMRSGKVTGRFDVTADDIGKLTDALEDFWKGSGLTGKPTKSLNLLITDRQRKEHGG